MAAKSPTKADLQVYNHQLEQTVGLLEERFAELELAIEDQGWVRLSAQSSREFSREGLKRIMLQAVMTYLKNPLIQSATQVQAHYVFGQGMTIHSPDDGVNKVIQSFLKDKKNKKVLTGPVARWEKEVELQTKANIFIVLFTNPQGKVQVRTIPAEEIDDIIRNPDDATEVWFYKRIYTKLEFDPVSGQLQQREHTVEYYPDWQYEPPSMPASFGGKPVMKDSPVYHIATNRLGDMRFGIPEHYAALDWAIAVTKDLEDYATIRRALARFAWKLTVGEGPKAVSAAKSKMGTTLGSSAGRTIESNPPAVAGSTWINRANAGNLEPIRTAGAAPNPEEGRRLWLMVSAGTGIPETMLSGDTSSGNYASARTLDRPTELKMRMRQELWAEVYKDILSYVLKKSRGTLTNELASPQDIERTVEAALREAQSIVTSGAIVDLGASPRGAQTDGEEDEVQVNVDFPAILDHDVLPRIQAIVQAATLNGQVTAGTMSDRTMIGLLLRALNVDNADALLDEILPGGADYFDTDNDPVAEPNPFLGNGEGPDGSNPFEEAVRPPKPPRGKKSGGRSIPPGKAEEEEDEENPNVDPETGVGLDEHGLHKVAPPPPSMRNQKGKSPNPFDATTPPPFGGNGQKGDTGDFKSDKDSQRVKGSTPPTRGPNAR